MAAVQYRFRKMDGLLGGLSADVAILGVPDFVCYHEK